MLAGLLAGFGFSIKYTGIAGVFYALGLLFLAAAMRRDSLWKQAAIGALCAFAVMAPWLVKNQVSVGNPVSPFLNGVFPNAYVHGNFERELSRSYRHMNGVTLPEIPLELAVRGQRLDGLIGPLFLLAPIGLLALRSIHGRRILFAAAVFGAPYFFNIGARFLLPALPFLALAMALALDRSGWLAALLAGAHLMLCWPAVVTRYASHGGWYIERPVWSAALRHIPESEYLRSHVDTYEMSLLLDKWVPASDRIFALSMDSSAYHSRELISSWASAFGDRQRETLARAVFPDVQPARRYVLAVAMSQARRLRLCQTSAPREALELYEIRVFQGQRELRRNAGWRVRAWPNPWETQAAFDASPLTYWSDWKADQPGAYVQIDFGRAEQFDRIEVDLPRAETWVQFAVDREMDGAWRRLPATSSASETARPPQLRRTAMEELKAQGIGWLVSRDGELLNADLAAWWGQWGITEVARSRGYHLWRVE